jgi:hypothetical protein
MSQYQGHLLLSLLAKHLQRLCHLPLARQGSRERQNLISPTLYANVHVLNGRHVSNTTISSIVVYGLTVDQRLHRGRGADLLHALVPRRLRCILCVDSLRTYHLVPHASC